MLSGQAITIGYQNKYQKLYILVFHILDESASLRNYLPQGKKPVIRLESTIPVQFDKQARPEAAEPGGLAM